MAFPLLAIPLILKGAAVVAGAVGLGAATKGAVDMKKANDKMKFTDARHKENIAKFTTQNELTSSHMDMLGKKELEILQSFEDFAQIFSKIHNKPEFKPYNKGDVTIPAYSSEDLKQVSIGAGILLGGIGGAAVGTAGGFAAAGATTAAIMALGTASTGTAIASLSGITATNATLALLGGGTLAAGGGGIAAGTAALGAATLGIGFLVGGIVFSIAGSTISSKADEAQSQMRKAEEDISKIVVYMQELLDAATNYLVAISGVNKIYKKNLDMLTYIVEVRKTTDWNNFSVEEKIVAENTALLVSLLYRMCKVEFVLQAKGNKEVNTVNVSAINKSITEANTFLEEKGLTVK